MSAFSKLSPQHQLVLAHYRANGRVQHEAWTAAGFEKRSARSTAARWFNSPPALAALAELDAKTLGKLEITAERVLDELALIGFANMRDFVTIADGKPDLDMSTVTRAQMAAVKQIKFGKDGEVTLQLCDKRAALVDLGKYLNLWKAARSDDDPTGLDIENTSDRELARRVLLAFALKVAGGTNGAKTPAPTKH